MRITRTVISRDEAERIHRAAKRSVKMVMEGIDAWTKGKLEAHLVFLRAGQNLSNQGIGDGDSIPRYTDYITIVSTRLGQMNFDQTLSFAASTIQ